MSYEFARKIEMKWFHFTSRNRIWNYRFCPQNRSEMIPFYGQKLNMKIMCLTRKIEMEWFHFAGRNSTHSARLEESSRGGLSRWAACSKELLASFSPKFCGRYWWELDSSRYFGLVWNRWRRGNCRRSRQWCRNGLNFVKSINKYEVKYACENKNLQINNLRAEFKIVSFLPVIHDSKMCCLIITK